MSLWRVSRAPKKKMFKKARNPNDNGEKALMDRIITKRGRSTAAETSFTELLPWLTE